MAGNDTLAQAYARLEAGSVADLAARLVRIPSHRGLERQEEAVVAELGRWLAARGLEVALDEAAPGRPNLLCTVRAARPGRRLIFCGHTDTVPLNADGAGHGFAGEVVDGRLRGRGAVDMKGPLAAMAVALAALDGVLPAGELTLAAVVDEEMESIGAERLVLAGLAAEGAIPASTVAEAIAHHGLDADAEVPWRG